jgi:predicted DNA binding CopG/RHH family protein
MSKAKRNQVPVFGSEEEERAFWAEQDSTDYVNWRSARRRSFPNLRPTLRTISLRLPEAMIEHFKVLANKRDVPYHSFAQAVAGRTAST